ncbi:uncharacterized protein KY384_009195 [Bacidia gigantensis]|uniref:uncharacterized protein n=1 Tax=Bacidia gigantensis TaxID=2732470 RepID=UPI001D043B84|nr:uncharacterized protein KY384_009195 [Bacidia gigantensis]KAG8525551.1 hypothetical protein KY384_009195 [Bacidia gigantensis]
MANAESREVDDDPFFYRACLRYDIDPSRGSYLASTDLSEWSSDDLCRVLQKTHGPTATADIVSRPYFWQRQNWVRPPKDLIQRAAEEKMALCTNRSGEWDARADGYFAISDVWAEGLYADPSNRGLPRAVIEQVFEMIKPLDVEWIWLDSLSVPGGRRYLSFEEELVREKLINNMGSIYRGAVAVVVFDRLTMSLASQDPINVGITLLFSRWFSRIWTLQEAKLASRVLILTKVGFTDLFHDIVEPLKNTGNFPHEKSKIDQLRTTLSRLVSSRGLPTSLHELVLLSAHRKARNDLDFSRALYACLGLDWIETFNEEQSTNYILENHKEEATQLLGMHGSPLLRNGYSWAPLRFRGLKGKFISGLEWEENGIRGDWCSYRVRTSHERRSASLPRESVLELELESDPLDTVVTVSCALSSEERPETIQGFKDAICDTRALLLSHNALDWIKNPVQRGSRQTVLLTRNEDSANEAFIFMTAGVITCDKPALTHEESWLIYHRSPLSNPLDSSIGDLALLEGQITELCRLGLEARLTRLDAERFASVQSAVDTFMANGMTAIHIVCTTGDVDALRILLDAGASIEMREKHFGMTPLQIAVAAQRIECVAALIDREARPNFASSSGQQPLALAVMHRNLRIVRLLVVAGANVDIVNERNGRTPLHTAVGMNNAAVVKVLLECDDAEGALGRADENGYQPYWLAVQDPDGDVLALIASKWSVGQEFVDNVRRWHRFWHVVAPCALSFSIPLALVLDIASLLLAHRGN